MDHDSGFLTDLPPTIKRYLYKGQKQFLEILDLEYNLLQQHGPAGQDTASEWRLFEIDEQTFARDFLNTTNPSSSSSSSSSSSTNKPWTSFDASQQILLAKVIMPEHAHAATAFHDALASALAPMGLRKALQTFSGTSIKGDHNNQGKQGDHGWGPLRPPRGRSQKWPAVVLEVTVSESPSKLQSDVRFWLGESHGDVNIVFTLVVNRQKPEIMIEKWERENGRPRRVQNVTIVKGKNGRVTVCNDPLVIEFEKLFLRQGTAPREKDIAIDRNELEDLAASIWCVQNL